MAVRGNLRDMGVAELIQHTCQEGMTARLSLEAGGEQAAIFFEAGEVVHATRGDQQGEQVIYDILGWSEGAFSLDADVRPPVRTIYRSYAGLLLEGARRMDEGAIGIVKEEADPLPRPEGGSQPQEMSLMDATAQALAKIQGVAGTVLVADDGVVLAQAIAGDAEKEGAVAAFVAAAADQTGEILQLGGFRRAGVTMGVGSMLVLRHMDHFVGLLLDGSASPSLVASRAEALLQGLR
jgi:predicted regulator of Ras-like GTPase activity (Roadblock/LC7/MglB family)